MTEIKLTKALEGALEIITKEVNKTKHVPLNSVQHLDQSTVNVFVGKKIRELRKERGINMAQISRMLNITYQQMQKYEKGENRINCGKLFMIACALEYDVSAFFPENYSDLN